LVQRRLIECLSRDRTKHQVAEVTSLGLIQMTRKKLGLGLLETFGEACEVCAGRGLIVHHEPVSKSRATDAPAETGNGARRGRGKQSPSKPPVVSGTHEITEGARSALAAIAASTVHADPAEAEKPSAGTKSPIADLDSLLDALPDAAPAERASRRPRRATKKSVPQAADTTE
jgi:ribonuclease E